MALILLTKQPAESRLYDFEFAGKMATGETISTVASATATPAGLTVGATSSSGTIAQVRLSGGTTATEYVVTVTVTTNLSNTLELEGRLWVEDVTALSAAEQEALDRLVIMVEANTCPTLDYDTAASELRVILTKHKRASVWTINTAYQIGDRIIPTAANRNGHKYVAVEYRTTGTDQTTGVTEPAWSTTRNAQIADDQIVWEEDGFDWNGDLWDLTAAARDGWLLKASKASLTSDVVRGELEIKSSQLFDHCMTMANQFQPVFLI